jgi:hypothetical protein
MFQEQVSNESTRQIWGYFAKLKFFGSCLHHPYVGMFSKSSKLAQTQDVFICNFVVAIKSC